MKTLAIVGSHPRGKETFDFDREDCDIWVFNEALKQEWIKRADAVFQMHLEAIWKNPNNRNDKDHYAWLSSGDTPEIVMQDVYKEVPKSTKYPLDEIVSKYLSRFSWTSKNREGNKYFSSTFCYALALGIFRGYGTIEVHGVEMETDTEYRYQRDGVTFWLGIALGKGVKVQAYCNIFDFPLYGYEGEATLHLHDIEKRIEELKPIQESGIEKYKQIAMKANDAIVLYMNEYKDPDKVLETLREQVTAAYEVNAAAGALEENERYKAKAEAMEAESGKFQFSRQEFEGAARGASKEYETNKNKAYVLSGRCDALFYKTKQKNRQRRRKALHEFAHVARAYIEESMKVGFAYGAMSENAAYMEKLDGLIKAAGGAKSEEVLLNAQV